MNESLKYTAMNAIDIQFYFDMNINYCETIQKYINENYVYSDFTMLSDEFSHNIVLIMNDVNNIEIKIIKRFTKKGVNYILIDYNKSISFEIN